MSPLRAEMSPNDAAATACRTLTGGSRADSDITYAALVVTRLSASGGSRMFGNTKIIRHELCTGATYVCEFNTEGALRYERDEQSNKRF